MPRIRLFILSFLYLLACATQAHANWVTHPNYKFTGKEHNVETDSKPNECLHLQFGAAEVGNANKANVETDSKPNECLHLQFGAAEVGYMSKANVETGYDYFGARFLAQQLGIWLSVDPLADKYIYSTPYMYCNGNPIKYVDPDGRKLRYGSNVSKEFKKQFAETINFMNSRGTAGIISRIEKREQIIYIVPTTGMSYFSPKRKTIYWNPKVGVLTKKGVVMSPATVLNHEADHALQEIENPEQKEIDCSTLDEQYNNAEERRVITGSEQITARKHEEIGLDEVTREDHKGSPYETISPISTICVNEVTVTASPIKDGGL